MTVLTLNREDVLKVLPKVDVFSTVEAMFGALGRGEAVQPKQVQTLFPNDKGDFINYTGVWMSAGVYGLKTSPFIVQEKGYTVTAWTLLMSTETGNPLLLVDSSRHGSDYGRCREVFGPKGRQTLGRHRHRSAGFGAYTVCVRTS